MLLKKHGQPQVHSTSTNRTQRQYRQVRSINTKERVFRKSWATRRTQNKYQASIPTSTQHQYETACCEEVAACHEYTTWVPKVNSISTYKYTVLLHDGGQNNNLLSQEQSMSTNTTQHQHQQVHSINTEGCVLANPWTATTRGHKHQKYTAATPTRTQHQYQRVYLFGIMGCHKYTAWVPQAHSTQNQPENSIVTTLGCWKQKHVLQQLDSMSTNRHSTNTNKCTASESKGVCLQHQGLPQGHGMSSTNT